jgi:hypothetical protein
MPSEAPRDRDAGRNRGLSRYFDHGYRSRSQPRYYVQRNARANARWKDLSPAQALARGE